MRNVLAFVVLYLLALFQTVAQITLDPTPSRVIGQDSVQISNVNPNLVEGREFFAPEGIALDLSTNPPGLYVADTGNNRVLGFRNAASFANGQKADVVLGQPDFATTLANTVTKTSTAATATLTSPTGLAVDSSGNVYVVDSGNNRILRFPAPFAQSGSQVPNLVIGQPGFATSAPNQGGISASTLAFSATNSILTAYIAFDSSGNLWVADAGNNRVLRFNAKSIGSQAAQGPAADLVLGQVDFVTNTYIPPSSPSTSLSTFNTPTGIAFDAGGRLFVAESVATQRGRILVYSPPFSSGQLASRLLGVDNAAPQPPVVNQFQLGGGPGNLFAVGNQIGIADTTNHRLLIFPSADQWTSNTLFQAAAQVVGQPDFNSGSANQGQTGASASTLSSPVAAVFSGTALFVADTLNHRVVAIPGSAAAFGAATAVLGQDTLNLNTENLIEGREFNFTGNSPATADTGIAVDLNSNPPHLYVADTYNNRVLGYKDLRNIQPGAKADIVIGQPDFQHSLINYPTNSAAGLSQSSLFHPTGLLVDSSGNLYVADSGNGRVLRFPAPFANNTPGVMEQADLVLGQTTFTNKIGDATAQTMAAPFGLAMTLFPGLLVSDPVHCRVLFFQGTSQTFTNGQAATVVFGQPNFTSSGPGSAADQMNAPRHIATDSDDRLYVADSGNRRVLIFNHSPSAGPDPAAAVILTNGLSVPHGIYVNPVNGEIWVADTGASAALRYPAFNALELTANNAPNAILNEYFPLALTEDTWGNLYVADIANRVVIHYPALNALNAANYLASNVLAPGMISAVYSLGNYHQFGTTSQTSSSLPLPRQLNGVEVLFNGSPVPLFFAGTDQINFQVPIGAPQSGPADLQVEEAATGRLMGAATVTMTSTLPGLFTQAANGSGAAIATNEDGTLNTQSNPAVAGHIITLYGTGQGFIAGAPPDGAVSGTQLQTAQPPTVFIGSQVQSGSAIKYAGLAPTLVGVWQLNVVIPSDAITLANNPTIVLAVQGGVPSGNATRVVQIYVKQ